MLAKRHTLSNTISRILRCQVTREACVTGATVMTGFSLVSRHACLLSVTAERPEKKDAYKSDKKNLHGACLSGVLSKIKTDAISLINQSN